MKTIIEPTLPVSVKSNQYGWPCKTYYYIVDANGNTLHISDYKWRKKCLIELNTHAIREQHIAEKMASAFNK